MAGFTAHFEGLAELDRLLGELKGREGARIISDALNAGGEVFRAAIVERAPERVVHKGGSIPLGVLKLDVEIKPTVDEGKPAVSVQPGKYTWHIAEWVEWGHRMVRGGYSHRIYGRDGKWNGRWRGPGRQITKAGALYEVPQHEYIRPAYEASREQAVQAFVEAVRKGIEEKTNG